MSLQVEKMEKNMAKLTIEVAAEDLEKAMQNAYQKAKGRISIPGFRKGKAPRKMIEQMYGKGVFLEDAVNALIPEHYSKALAECELEIVSQPTIDITQAASTVKLAFLIFVRFLLIPLTVIIICLPNSLPEETEAAESLFCVHFYTTPEGFPHSRLSETDQCILFSQTHLSSALPQVPEKPVHLPFRSLRLSEC